MVKNINRTKKTKKTKKGKRKERTIHSSMIYPNPRVPSSVQVHVPMLGVGTEKIIIALLIKVIALKIRQEKRKRKPCKHKSIS